MTFRLMDWNPFRRWHYAHVPETGRTYRWKGLRWQILRVDCLFRRVNPRWVWEAYPMHQHPAEKVRARAHGVLKVNLFAMLGAMLGEMRRG